jgi:hypothetical protein
MEERNFWPLDFDPEGEIYENVAWDLPGYQPQPKKVSRARRRWFPLTKSSATSRRKHTTR